MFNSWTVRHVGWLHFRFTMRFTEGEREGETREAEDLEWSKSEVAVREEVRSVLHGGGHHASAFGLSLVLYDCLHSYARLPR